MSWSESLVLKATHHNSASHCLKRCDDMNECAYQYLVILVECERLASTHTNFYTQVFSTTQAPAIGLSASLYAISIGYSRI